jgi:hypothetical protein
MGQRRQADGPDELPQLEKREKGEKREKEFKIQ